MIVEIQGTSAVNKGAWLMHCAVETAVKERWPDAKIVVKRRGFKLSEIKKFGYGWYIDNELLKKVPVLKAIKIIPKRLRNILSLYTAKDIDVKFDASGYIIGDNWDLRYIKSRFSDMDELRDDCLTVLLPQAFGPFNKESNQKDYTEILKKFDLVFARDPMSLEYIQQTTGLDTVLYYPDFTNLLKPSEFSNQGDVCIVPNCKLYESGRMSREKVVELFVNFISSFQKCGLSVFFLMHEGPKDVKLAEDINIKLKHSIKIIDPNDPIKIKSIIGGSKILVTGRFHGLASSLSTNVPSISLSWSHKYKMLMNLYGIDDSYIVSQELTSEEVDSIVDKIVSNLDNYKHTLLQSSKKVEDRSKEMWKLIFSKVK